MHGVGRFSMDFEILKPLLNEPLINVLLMGEGFSEHKNENNEAITRIMVYFDATNVVMAMSVDV